MNSFAVSRNPWVKESSATIVATPTAMPPAVKTVRARLRSRLVVMIASIGQCVLHLGRGERRLGGGLDLPVDERHRAVGARAHPLVVADDDHRHADLLA